MATRPGGSQDDALWNSHEKRLQELRILDKIFLVHDVCERSYRQISAVSLMMSTGLGSETKALAALERWGPNIFEVPLPSFGALLQEQLLAPFFVFQAFCIGLWSLDDYWCVPTLSLQIARHLLASSSFGRQNPCRQELR